MENIFKTLEEQRFLMKLAPDFKEELEVVSDKLTDEVKALIALRNHAERELELFYESNKKCMEHTQHLIDLTYIIKPAPTNKELAQTQSPVHTSPDIKSIKAMQDILIKRGKVV